MTQYSPWCLRCPEGHASVKQPAGENYWCRACGKRYDGDPYNMNNAADRKKVQRGSND